MALREQPRTPDPAEAALHVRATPLGDIECVHGEERLWCVSGEPHWHRLAAELSLAIADAGAIRGRPAPRVPRGEHRSHDDPDNRGE